MADPLKNTKPVIVESFDEIETAQPISSPEPSYDRSQESWFGSAGRQILRGMERGIEGTLAIPDLLKSSSDYLIKNAIDFENISPEQQQTIDRALQSRRLPTSQEFRSFAETPFGKGYLESENALEKTIDRATFQLPYMLFGGMPAIGKSLVTASAGQLTEEAGGGPLSQLAAELATGGIYNYVTKAANPAQLTKFIEEDRSKSYKAAEKFLSADITPEKGSIEGANRAINKLRGRSSGLTTRLQSEVLNEAIDVKTLLKKGFVTGDELLEKRNHLYKIMGQNPFKGNSEAKDYLSRLAKSLNKTLTPRAEQFGESGLQFLKGDKLTTALRGSERARSTMEKALKSENLLQNLSRSFKTSGLFGTTFKGIKDVSKFLLGDLKPSPELKTFWNEAPGFKNYYTKAIASAAIGNLQDTIRNIKNLTKVVEGKTKKISKIKKLKPIIVESFTEF